MSSSIRAAPRGAPTRRVGALAAVIVASAGIAACGGSSSPSTASTTPHANGVLDTQRVAMAIAQSIKAQRHIKATVVCPPHVPQEQGLTFTCVATTYSRKKPVHTLFTVEQKDSNGNVYYQSPQ
jgi:hypothetical protein